MWEGLIEPRATFDVDNGSALSDDRRNSISLEEVIVSTT